MINLEETYAKLRIFPKIFFANRASDLSCRRVDFHGNLVDGEVGPDGHREPYETAAVGLGDDRHDAGPGSGASLRRQVERKLNHEPRRRVRRPTQSTVHPARIDEVRQVHATQHRLSKPSALSRPRHYIVVVYYAGRVQR